MRLRLGLHGRSRRIAAAALGPTRIPVTLLVCQQRSQELLWEANKMPYYRREERAMPLEISIRIDFYNSIVQVLCHSATFLLVFVCRQIYKKWQSLKRTDQIAHLTHYAYNYITWSLSITTVVIIQRQNSLVVVIKRTHVCYCFLIDSHGVQSGAANMHTGTIMRNASMYTKSFSKHNVELYTQGNN